jgi:hypothetical protein
MTLRMRQWTLESIIWDFLSSNPCKQRSVLSVVSEWALTYDKKTGMVLTSQYWPLPSFGLLSVDPPLAHLPLSVLQAETVQEKIPVIQISDIYHIKCQVKLLH